MAEEHRKNLRFAIGAVLKICSESLQYLIRPWPMCISEKNKVQNVKLKSRII